MDADHGVDYVPVSSSNVAMIGWRRETEDLFVRFSSGARYVYHGVNEDTYTKFLEAPSKGKYLHTQIKGRYSYERI